MGFSMFFVGLGCLTGPPLAGRFFVFSNIISKLNNAVSKQRVIQNSQAWFIRLERYHFGMCVSLLKRGTNISPFATARGIMSLFFI